MNQENRRQIIILVVVLLLLGAAVTYSMSAGPGGGSPNPALAKAGGSAAGTEGSGIATFESVFQDVEVDIEQLIQNIEPFEFIYNDVRIARNPAAPVVQNDEIDPSTWPKTDVAIGDDSIIFFAEQKEVTGIIWDETSPLAVIDGEVVGEGHEFALTGSDKTIVVKTIAEDFVVLSIPSEDLDVSKYLQEVEES